MRCPTTKFGVPAEIWCSSFERRLRKMIRRDGFDFTSFVYPFSQHNAIRIEFNRHSLAEYVQYVNDHNIEQAEIIMPELDFLEACPSLRYLKIHPSSTSVKYDFSPLYKHPEIRYLHCINEYCLLEGKRMPHIAELDYSKIHGLIHASITANCGSKHFNSVSTLKSLVIGGFQNETKDLFGMFCSKELDTLSLLECRESSLDGIEISERMQCLYISYNRRLRNIDALRTIKHTLKALRIVNCPKIEDFSVLSELEELRLLEISGNSILPNLTFLRNMPKLKTFVFNGTIADGDLSPCLDLSYVHIGKFKRHYFPKPKDLPRGEIIRGNEDIDMWRRLE